MTNSAYDPALQKASEELATALEERDRWILEVARLYNLVISLSTAAGLTPVAVGEKGTFSFTETVLATVTRTPEPMSAVQVRDAMVSFGQDLSKYSNPLSHIHQTLKRLAVQGRLVEINGTYKRTPLYESLLRVSSKGQRDN